MQHTKLENGHWFELTLYEQLGNVGTEVGRMVRARKRKNSPDFLNARDRALELLDLTIADPKRKHQLREITRVREVLIDSISEKSSYNSDLAALDRYFINFAYAARLNR